MDHNTLPYILYLTGKKAYVLPNFSKLKILYLYDCKGITIPNYNTLEELHMDCCKNITILNDVSKIKTVNR